MEYYIAFIVLCSTPECVDKRTYSDRAHHDYEICKKHARGWAMQMKAMTDTDYSFGCRKMDYQPREIK